MTSEYEMEKLIREIKISSHKNLSLCYLKLKKYTECFEECRHVLDIDPNCVKIIYRVGKAYMSLGNYQEAETYLLRGFMLDPHENEIMRALEEI